MSNKINYKVAFLILLSVIMLSMPMRVFAIDNNKLGDKEVNKDKVWRVKFNIPLNSNTIYSSVYVNDSLGNKVNVSLKLSDEGKTVLIYPPVTNYENNKEYILYIDNNIKAINGNKLKTGARLKFFVSNNNSSNENNTINADFNAIAKVEVSPVMDAFKVITIKNINDSEIKKFKIEGNNNLFDVGKSALSIVSSDKVTIYFYKEDGVRLMGKGVLDVSKTLDNVEIKIQ